MRALAAGLIAAGADVVLAGCTEIPLVLGQADVAAPLVDSLDALARRTVAVASSRDPRTAWPSPSPS
jgi:aspartate racemase